METLQKQLGVNELISKDFGVFVEEIIGLDNEEFHNDIDHILSDSDYKKIAIAISRDHGKSTHLSIAYPLWEIARNHNLRILLVSSTGGTSSKFLSQILNHIERNQAYIDWAKWMDPEHKGVVPQTKFGSETQESKWSGEAITINRSDLNLKDYTIQAVGLFGSILSGRADIIIVDDLVNQKNSETMDQREKVKDWFHTTLEPILVPGGKIIYLGNTWHQQDLIAELLNDPLVDYRRRLPAIIHDATRRDLWLQWADIFLKDDIDIKEKNKLGAEFYAANKVDMDEGVQVLWPSRHPYGSLFLKRLRNSYSFSRMYQCDPSENPDQKIKDEWIEKALERGKFLRLSDAPRENLQMRDTTGGLDLAISQRKTSDDTAFTTLDQVELGDASFRPGDYILRNITSGKFTAGETREMVKQKYTDIGHTGIRVESVAYQDSMRRDLGDMAIPVRGHYTGGEKNDSTIGVNSIAILLELGKLVLPFDRTDAHTVDEISKLVNELRAWPDGHTGDRLMSLWFALLEMRDHKGRGVVTPRRAWDGGNNIETTGKTQEQIDFELDMQIIRESDARRAGLPVPVAASSYDGSEPYVKKYTF